MGVLCNIINVITLNLFNAPLLKKVCIYVCVYMYKYTNMYKLLFILFKATYIAFQETNLHFYQFLLSLGIEPMTFYLFMYSPILKT